MAQNINLLTELQIQPGTAFTSKFMGQLVAAWVLLLILIYIVAFGIHTTKQQNLAKLAAIHNNLLTTINTHTQELATSQVPALLANQELAGSSQSTLGFSRYLEDLATFVPDDVWLTEINFTALDNTITIKGKAITAASVALFLNHLSQAPSLGNKKFNTLHLQINPESNDIDFIISTVSNINSKTQITTNE